MDAGKCILIWKHCLLDYLGCLATYVSVHSVLITVAVMASVTVPPHLAMSPLASICHDILEVLLLRDCGH